MSKYDWTYNKTDQTLTHKTSGQVIKIEAGMYLSDYHLNGEIEPTNKKSEPTYVGNRGIINPNRTKLSCPSKPMKVYKCYIDREKIWDTEHKLRRED